MHATVSLRGSVLPFSYRLSLVFFRRMLGNELRKSQSDAGGAVLQRGRGSYLHQPARKRPEVAHRRRAVSALRCDGDTGVAVDCPGGEVAVISGGEGRWFRFLTAAVRLQPKRAWEPIGDQSKGRYGPTAEGRTAIIRRVVFFSHWLIPCREEQPDFDPSRGGLDHSLAVVPRTGELPIDVAHGEDEPARSADPTSRPSVRPLVTSGTERTVARVAVSTFRALPAVDPVSRSKPLVHPR